MENQLYIIQFPHSTATSKLFYNIAIQSPSSLEKDKPKNGTKYQDGDHHTYNSASNGGRV